MSGEVILNGGARPQPTRWNVLYAGECTSSTHQSPQRRRTYGKRTPGFGELPYIVRPTGNVPAGVAPSPSRLSARTPLRPTRAAYAPPTATQQEPSRFQIRAVAH